MLRRSISGFSLVEMLVVVAVLSIVLAIAIPSLSNWMANIRVRSRTESIVAGMQQARSEATHRNARILFEVTAGGGWTYGCVISTATCPAVIEQRSDPETGKGLKVGSEGSDDTLSNSKLTFSGVGMRIDNPIDGGNVPPSLTQIDISSDGATPLRILIGNTGQARMCRPDLATGSMAC